MLDLLFSGQAPWFSVPALVGTGVFVIRLILMLVGGHAGDFDGDVGDAHHGDPGSAFKALTFQSIIAFLAGFGWTGLGMLRGANQGWLLSVAVAIAGGVAMVWLLGLLLKAIHDLGSSGNIPISHSLGQTGSVYVGVPARGEGRGQVRLVVDGRDRILNAVSEADAIPTRAQVRVTKVNQDNTVTVAAV